MTARRQESEVHRGSVDDIRAALGRALTRPPRGYRYVRTVQDDSGGRITTILRHWTWPLVLQTPVVITVAPGAEEGSCSVVVSTEPQPDIHGDMFGSYKRYIRHILRELQRELAEDT